MYRINNLQDNDDIRVADAKAGMKVIEYMSDLSVMPSTAITAYYCSRMNVRKRQLLINLEDNEYTKAQVQCNGLLVMLKLWQMLKESEIFLARQ